MTQRRHILSLIISIILITTVISINSTSATDFYTVRGDVYIDDILAGAGLEVNLYFDTAINPPSDLTNANGAYAIDWQSQGGSYVGETGYFNVDYAGDTYAAFDEFGTLAYIDIEPDTIGYVRDLYIYTSMPNVPPIAHANGPYTAAVGVPRTFDATGSFDPDGTITTYQWDFNGDGTFDISVTSKTVSHTYSTAGTVTVTLQVTDNDGATDTDTASTTILASDTTPPSKVTGLTVTNKKNGKLELNWEAATDNVEVQHYKIYRDGIYKYTVNALTYLDTGLTNGQKYTYQVSAVDTSDNEGEKSDNASGTPTQSTTGGGGGGAPIINNPPTANAGGPYTGTVGEQITFDGSGSTGGDGTIESWEWDFDDGTTGSGETITHSYNTAGTYTVTLTVTDDFGSTDDDDALVTIIQPNIPPTTPLITGPTSGDSDTTYDFTAMSTDEDNDTLTYEFAWDDGTDDTSNPLESGEIYTTTHMWTTGGAYDIVVSVSDNQTSTDATHRILIDAEYTEDIGYIVDTDGDDLYDIFHSNETNDETDLGRITGGEYLIDEDDDGDWDWIYNTETKQLRQYTEAEEVDYTLWILLIILIIVILIFAGLIMRSNRMKKQQKTKKTEKKK